MDTEKKTARERWEEAYAKSEERDDIEFSTMSGTPIKPMYGPDVVDVDFEEKIGYAGRGRGRVRCRRNLANNRAMPVRSQAWQKAFA